MRESIGEVRLYHVCDFSEEAEDDIDLNLPLSYDMFYVSVTTQGSFQVNLNLVSYTIGEGDVMLYSPMALAEIKGYTTDYQAVVIGIAPGLFREIGFPSMNLFPFMDVRVVRANKDKVCILTFLLRRLRRLSGNPTLHFHHGEVTRHYLIALLYELIDLCGKQILGYSNNKFSRKEALKAQFLDCVMKCFMENRSVQFYADKLFVTPKYLSEVVKSLTGKTAGEVIDEAVALEARLMLSQSGATVKEVSEKLHFSDASFFGKFFKRYTGMSPSDYKSFHKQDTKV